ncbi:MAG: FprA family A-type flavoprotein [Anaerolineae bacterium]|nr:FprA family A-type flavoprotein [Anaerolineae bacterium]MDW8102200.1 FprA family A-type flavoprotein [Anaerolineae bacterium]
MPPISIAPGIFWVGINDRTTDLFEGLWPIEREGVSYNYYIILDEKKVLIDLAKGFKTDEFFSNIAEVTNPAEIDYVVINHMEPDHTGTLYTFRQVAPKATIIVTPKGAELLKNFFGITENVKVVEDGELLTLGQRTLRFLHTPFVHWPETMMTYETNSQILFSCDAFGGYGALRGAIFEDECTDLDFYKKEALRYYVTVVATFSGPVLRAIEKLKDLKIDIIAPSHGLLWRKNPSVIVELYRLWASYATSPGEPAVTLIYGSMYGNTEKFMNAVAQGVSREGVPVEIFDAARVHPAYILPYLWTRQGVIIGAPTYEGGLFPPVAHALDIAALKRVMNKKAAYFGSYGWSGGALRRLKEILERLKWELVDTLVFAGRPEPEELKKGEEFGAKFARLIKETP